jgi:hypothetical protein
MMIGVLEQNFQKNREDLIQVLYARGEHAHYENALSSKEAPKMLIQSDDKDFKELIQTKFDAYEMGSFQRRLFSHLVYEYPGQAHTLHHHLMDRDGNLLFNYVGTFRDIEKTNPDEAHQARINFVNSSLSNKPHEGYHKQNFMLEGQSYKASTYEQLIHCAFCCVLGREQTKKQKMSADVKEKTIDFYTQLQICNLQTADALYILADEMSRNLLVNIEKKAFRYPKRKLAA